MKGEHYFERVSINKSENDQAETEPMEKESEFHFKNFVGNDD